jgi:hypothetical protein
LLVFLISATPWLSTINRMPITIKEAPAIHRTPNRSSNTKYPIKPVHTKLIADPTTVTINDECLSKAFKKLETINPFAAIIDTKNTTRIRRTKFAQLEELFRCSAQVVLIKSVNELSANAIFPVIVATHPKIPQITMRNIADLLDRINYSFAYLFVRLRLTLSSVILYNFVTIAQQYNS